MMKKILTAVKILALALLALPSANMVNAQSAPPHSVKATASYNSVAISWEAPANDIKLKWHNEYDYNAADGKTFNSEDVTTFYVANYFTADDLKNYVGKKVKSVSYMQYRPIYRATVMVYIDEEVVAEKADDQSNFESGEEMIVELDSPVEIPAGKSMRFAVKFECGANLDMVATCDAGPAIVGKGDCFSTDGVNWTSDNIGNFWVTARLVNEATAEADGYNVYCDNVKLNSELVTDTEYVAENQEKGSHQYSIAAVYGSEEAMSYSVPVTINVFPSPSMLSAESNVFTNTLVWQAPALDTNLLTWSNQELQNGIGGTSTSSPKIWIKNDFNASDLIAYAGAKLSAINIFLFEESSSEISQCTLFLMENGKIVYSEQLSDEALAALTLGAWNKMTLSTPYTITAGKDMAYGLYITHTAKKHPIGFDTCPIGNIGKGTMYSTSSPKSDFNASNPSWKDLSDAGMTGNWMLTADVSGATTMALDSYEIYRNGEKIADNIKDNTYTDEVEAPGYYTYGVVAVGTDGSSSDASEAILSVDLPDSYRAPYIETATFDSDSKEFNLSWSMDAEMKHYNTPTYMVGFEEEMAIMVGTKFTASELESYKGYTINRLKGMLYENVGDIKMGVYSSKGAVLSETTIAEGEYAVGTTITAELPTPVAVTGEEDIIIAYTLNLPANSSALVIDEGPLVENGALISLTGGMNWMKLGTILSIANDYNIVISALLTPESAKASKKVAKETYKLQPLAENEIEPAKAAVKSSKPAPSNNPQAVSYKVYCNNALVAEPTEFNYIETLKRFGPYVYEVSAIYSNGWESPRSEQIRFTNGIEQKNPAPFDLKGNLEDGNLTLSWSDTSAAKVMSYEQGDEDNAFQLSGSGDGFYAVIKYTKADLADKVGMKISHIRFKLATADLYSLNAIVMYGQNVVYSQPVDLDDVVVGYNTIRLDNPVEIPANWEVGVGYHIDGPTGVAMLVMDGGPAVENYSDVYSTSGSSWYSMLKKNKADYSWRISATLETADQEIEMNKVKARSTSTTTYNVYRSGQKIASDLTDTNYVVTNAKGGEYYVTAVTDNVESAESNSVKVIDPYFGVDNVDADLTVVYDAATQDIRMSAVGNCEVYSVSGALVKSAMEVSSLNVSDLGSGVYVAKVEIDGSMTTIKIVK